MRNMSFSLTTPQYRARLKLVTRRLGWADLTPGEKFMGVVKGMGLRKGEKVERIHAATCVSNTPETLKRMIWDQAYGKREVILEGFPELTPRQFVEMFCKHNRCAPEATVQRIAFVHHSA